MSNNSAIISELLETAEYYEARGDEGRSCAYKRAINSIEKYNNTITSGEQAKQLKWIGDGIAGKIDSILGISSSTISDQTLVQSHKSTNNSRSSNIRTSVTLIDDIRSKNKQKHKTPVNKEKDYITHKNKTSKQKQNKNSRTLRIKQYEYAKKPEIDASVVTRGELDKFVTCVRKIWTKIIQKESTKSNTYSGRIECCGTFRRGKRWCHECVIILQSNVHLKRKYNMFSKLIEVLYKLRLINSTRMNEHDYYKGVLDISKLFKSERTNDYPDKQTNVPLVLRLVEPDALPCALLYWTGPNNYWNKLQSVAYQQGFELLEQGLYHKSQNGLGKKLYHRDEYDVLTDIGMDFVEPIYRK